MRMFIIPAAAFILAASTPARAAVEIEVNKDVQQMTVSVDGVVKYRWPVSTGNPSHETPNGSFKTFRMEEDHYSKEFDDAPMPHSIFFTKIGHAIHGTDSVKSLGLPVSHGCVRLSRANATKLWDLVKQEGLFKTTVNLTGSSRVALARARTNVATEDDSSLDANAGVAPGQPMDLNNQRRSTGGFFGWGEDNNAAQQAPSYQPQPQVQAQQQRRPYYDNLSAPDPRSPGRRIYADPNYDRSTNNNGYAQDYNYRTQRRYQPFFSDND